MALGSRVIMLGGAAGGARHKVPGPRTYGDKTYAWVLSQVQRMPPKPIKRNASVIWQTGPGGC